MSKKLFSILAALAMVVSVVGVVPLAFANEEEVTPLTTTVAAEDEQPARGTALKNKLQELKAERQEQRQNRLAANKLRVCENRKTRITAIMNRAIIRAERQLKLFDTIAERVKAFYVEKGYTLENYDELVAAVDSAKADAEANLETLKGLEAFDCNSEDPKGQLEAFKLALASIREDLKDYRTSVKNLIVGVKSANSNPGGSGEEGGEE